MNDGRDKNVNIYSNSEQKVHRTQKVPLSLAEKVDWDWNKQEIEKEWLLQLIYKTQVTE